VHRLAQATTCSPGRWPHDFITGTGGRNHGWLWLRLAAWVVRATDIAALCRANSSDPYRIAVSQGLMGACSTSSVRHGTYLISRVGAPSTSPAHYRAAASGHPAHRLEHASRDYRCPALQAGRQQPLHRLLVQQRDRPASRMQSRPGRRRAAPSRRHGPSLPQVPERPVPVSHSLAPGRSSLPTLVETTNRSRGTKPRFISVPWRRSAAPGRRGTSQMALSKWPDMNPLCP
jgi:hypothetical protein